MVNLLVVMSLCAYAQVQSPEVRKAIPIATSEGLRGPQHNGERQIAGKTRGEPSTMDLATAPSERREESYDSTRPGYKVQSGPSTMKALNDKHKIGIRDRISLTIVEDEEPSKQLIVTDSGEVDVPDIGRVDVRNRTCKEFAYYLKELLEKELYYQATVLISLDTAGSSIMSKGKYYIVGQVGRAGVYEIPSDEKFTVSKAIIRAGGFTQYANRRKVRLFRQTEDRGVAGIIELDLVEVMDKGNTKKDIEIQPEDRLDVPEKFFNF